MLIAICFAEMNAVYCVEVYLATGRGFMLHVLRDLLHGVGAGLLTCDAAGACGATAADQVLVSGTLFARGCYVIERVLRRC